MCIRDRLNVMEFGMTPQEAVEAPRFETLHFVSSFEDHRFQPGVLRVDARIDPATIEELRKRGHKVEIRPAFEPTSAPTIIIFNHTTKVIEAGADVRRGRYAVGW